MRRNVQNSSKRRGKKKLAFSHVSFMFERNHNGFGLPFHCTRIFQHFSWLPFDGIECRSGREKVRNQEWGKIGGKKKTFNTHLFTFFEFNFLIWLISFQYRRAALLHVLKWSFCGFPKELEHKYAYTLHRHIWNAFTGKNQQLHSILCPLNAFLYCIFATNSYYSQKTPKHQGWFN